MVITYMRSMFSVTNASSSARSSWMKFDVSSVNGKQGTGEHGVRVSDTYVNMLTDFAPSHTYAAVSW